ncbi:hypothetical protein V5H98_15210 [Georgenia sp. M64]|uniref:hypothetical protein n=1 Tax=Georgenia sp. M64 TaxID=3120520 RepID=UPI0030E03C10
MITPAHMQGQLRAALILARQTVTLLEEVTATAPPRTPAPAVAPGQRRPYPWRGRTLELTDDERAVLQVLADGADDDGAYRRGREELARTCRMGAQRLRAALSGLSAPEGGQPPVRSVPGPHGRTDYALTDGSGEEAPQE